MKINGKVGKKRTRATALRPCGMWLPPHPLSWSFDSLECHGTSHGYASIVLGRWEHIQQPCWSQRTTELHWVNFEDTRLWLNYEFCILFTRARRLCEVIWKLKLKQRWIFKLDNELKHVSKTTKEVFKWRKRELAIMDFKLFLVMWRRVNSLNYETKMHFTCSGFLFNNEKLLESL